MQCLKEICNKTEKMLFAVVPISTGRLSGSALGFLGGAGINGGQNNADALFGSADDHDMFGVSGPGWYGPGNGEEIGELWNPARAPRFNLQ